MNWKLTRNREGALLLPKGPHLGFISATRVSSVSSHIMFLRGSVGAVA